MSFRKPRLTPAHSTGSLNRFLGSVTNARPPLPHVINFTAEGNGWRKGTTEAWYQEQLAPGRSTTFRSLEYRKDREAPFYHEYIVVYLVNDTVCRFERRGHINKAINILLGDPIHSEDTAEIITKFDKDRYDQIKDQSDLLLTLKFPRGQDLLNILAICYGIQANKTTQGFTLTRYNSYFFAWMIVIATARSTVDWALVAKENSLWEALVASVKHAFDPHPGPTWSPAPQATIPANQFVGSAHLIDSLCMGLGKAREQIQTFLSEHIIFSTLGDDIRHISETPSEVGGEGTRPISTANWEEAWDIAWEQCWSRREVSEQLVSNTDSDDSSKISISARAKVAWIQAWDEILQAADQYVPMFSTAMADYIVKNLPETIPEVLTYEADENVPKRMAKELTLTKGSSNADLQKWVMGRIVAHCQRVSRLTAGAQRPSKVEFQEAMKDVWKLTLSCAL